MSKKALAVLIAMAIIIMGLSGTVIAAAESDSIGFYNQADGRFALKNDLTGGPADYWFTFGKGGTSIYPVAGDWNGDGEYGIGFYNQADGRFALKNDLSGGAADYWFRIGVGGAGTYPVAGLWGPLDIVNTAIAADDFEYLVAAVVEAGLVDALKAEGPFTVFAPTDEAFEGLLAELGITVEELLALDNLRSILLYHVLEGQFLAEDVIAAAPLEVETLQGSNVKITLANGDVFVNDAKVIMTDILCTNGVIHAIDTVLLPELEVIDVSNADELYDALLDQCDYDIIRFTADIDVGVDYDVRLSCDDLIFNLNGYTLALEDGYNFQVRADNITIKGSEIVIPDGDFEADTNGDITLTIDGVEFNIPNGDFEIYADYEGVVSRVDITESVFNVGGSFYYDIDEDYTEGTLNINRSDFDLGERFYVDADDDGVKLNVNISDSKFVIADGSHQENFWIDADSTGVRADITITNTVFDLGDSDLRIETRRAAKASILLENITFTSLGKLIIEGDMELNGAIFKEDAGTVILEWWSNDQTLTLNGDIVLEHEGNVLRLSDNGWYNAQIKGDAVVGGEGKVDIGPFSQDESAIFDLTFEVLVEINDAVLLRNVTLADTIVNSDFTVSGTVTLTEDMVLGDNVTIYAARAPLPLADGVTIRGTLVGEGDVAIDGDNWSYRLFLGDKLKVENVTFTNINWLFIGYEATVVFEDITLGSIGVLDFLEKAKLVLASDIVATETIASAFIDDEGVLDGDGFSILTDDDAFVIFDGASGGTVKNLTFELLVIYEGNDYFFEEVYFNAAYVPGVGSVDVAFEPEGGSTRKSEKMTDVLSALGSADPEIAISLMVLNDFYMIGGGWAADTTVMLENWSGLTLTFEAGAAKVNNAGLLFVGPYEHEIAFATDMETDLQYPIGITDVDFDEALPADISQPMPFDLAFTVEGMNATTTTINLGTGLELASGNFKVLDEDDEELSSYWVNVQPGDLETTDAELTIYFYEYFATPGVYRVVHDDGGVNEGIVVTKDAEATIEAVAEMVGLEYEFFYEIYEIIEPEPLTMD